VIGHIAFKPELAEPAIGEIEVNFLAEPSLGGILKCGASARLATTQLLGQHPA